MRFMPGDVLYQVSDLSSVWVVADVFEQDIAAVRTGARARVTIDAYPAKALDAALTYVYPTSEYRDAYRAGTAGACRPEGLLEARHVRPGGIARWAPRRGC